MNQNLLSGTITESNENNTIQLYEDWQIPRNILKNDQILIIKGLIVIYLVSELGVKIFIDFKRTGEVLNMQSYDLNEKLDQVRAIALRYSEILILNEETPNSNK
jgi:hypothetical protein